MKYKVGDIIKIVKKGDSWCCDGSMDHMLGQVVVIAFVDDCCTPGIGVIDSKAKGVSQFGMWWFNEEEVELVKE